MLYEVKITYSGTDTYVVDAADPDAAKDIARDRFGNGETAESPGAERIDDFEVSEYVE